MIRIRLTPAGLLPALLLLATMAGGCASGGRSLAPMDAVLPADWREGRAGGAALPDEVWIVARGGGSPAFGAGALLRVEDGRATAPIALVETEIRGTILGPIASLRRIERFENAGPAAIDVVFAWPLPAAAAVHDFVVTIGDRRIRGIVLDRNEAVPMYERARRSGLRATLLTEDGSGTFTQRLGSVPAGTGIVVEVGYDDALVPTPDGAWTLTVPAGHDPRYHGERAPQVVGDLFVLGHATVTCPSHASARVERDGARTRVHLVGVASTPDVLLRVAPEEPAGMIVVEGDERGGTLLISCPAPGAAGDLRLDWPGARLDDALPRGVRAGAPIVLTGHYAGAAPARVALVTNGVSRPLLVAAGDAEGAVTRLWARRCVRRMIENGFMSHAREVSHRHGLVGPLTAMITVDPSP